MKSVPHDVEGRRQGRDVLHFLSRLHPRYHTPVLAIAMYALVCWILALNGTFLLLAAVTAGAVAIEYIGICATLIKLRKLQPSAPVLRLPGGPIVAAAGIVICLMLLTRLKVRELLLMGVTAAFAIANWWWAKQHALSRSEVKIVSPSPSG